MTNIVLFVWYPPEKGPEIVGVGQKVTEKFPPDDSLGKVLVPVTFTSGKDGIFAMTVFEPAEGKLAEALARTADMMFMYHGIEGFRYEIKTFVTLEEAGERTARLQ